MSNESDTIVLVRMPNNGGCGDACKCHCHGDEEDIPAGHVAGCLFEDPGYTPPGFREAVTEAMRHVEHDAAKYLRGNRGKPS